MRRWLLPLLLAAAIVPSLAAAISTVASLLGRGETPSAAVVLLDVLPAAAGIGLALTVLRLVDSGRGSPLWLLDWRALRLRAPALSSDRQAADS